ncbi:MAG: DUF4173 domain-containing protein [Capsulimonadales bacterium]|nr:DUF4173 domain-containing protein [Capsulimonadales bacterium]
MNQASEEPTADKTEARPPEPFPLEELLASPDLNITTGTLPPATVSNPGPGEDFRPRIVGTGGLLLVAGLLGFLFDTCCGTRPIGIGFPIYIALYLGGMLVIGHRERVAFRKETFALLLPPILFFATMVAVRANGFLIFWNFVATVVLSLLLQYYAVAGDFTRIGFAGFLGDPWKVFGHAMHRAAPVVADASRTATENAEARRRAMPVVRGLLLALPILCVFVALLAAADELFGRIVGDLFARILPEDWVDRLPHLLLSVLAAWLTAGGIAYALTRRESNRASTVGAGVRIGFTETMIVLGSVAVVFGAFVALQSSYFFGGIDFARSIGLNYATYARRGFWELVTVAVLTLTLIHCFRRTGTRDGVRQESAFIGVGTLLVGFTLVLLSSAMQRMHAYEAAWGATPLRLIVDGFIIWLGIALLWFVVTLRKWSERFVFGVLACGVGYLVTLNLINPDEYVMERNLAQYARTKTLCRETLFKLSADAVPTMVDAYDKLPPGRERNDLADVLRYHRDLLAGKERPRPDYHFAEAEASRALERWHGR